MNSGWNQSGDIEDWERDMENPEPAWSPASIVILLIGVFTLGTLLLVWLLT